MSGIFATNAPKYWEHNLPVIPLRPKQKRPIPNNWSVFAEQMPSLDMQTDWLRQHGDGNIGLALGPQSTICALDVDTDDPKVHRLVESILPRSPWRRFGAKGFVLAFRYNGIKTFQIKNQDGGMILELLSSRRQVVLPPSIHPDTSRPYQANCDLLDVYRDLPKLPSDVETLVRQGLMELGYSLSVTGSTKLTEYVAPGARDNQMIKVAGMYANAVLRGEVSFVEAIDQMQGWCDARVEKVAGDDVDINKGILRMAEFLINDVTGSKRRPLPNNWDLGLTQEMRQGFGLDALTEEFKTVPLDVLRKELEVSFVSAANTDEKFSILEKTLDRVSRYEPNAFAEEFFLKTVAHQSGLGITAVALRKRIRELRQGDTEGIDHTEIAQSVIEYMSQFGEVKFDQGCFWQWNGSHWQKLDDRAIMKIISENFGSLPAARKAHDHRGIMNTMATHVFRPVVESAVKGVNFANGFLTPEMRLIPHDPAYGARYTLPYRYMPELADKCPKWLDFLEDRWSGDFDKNDKIKALQEVMGATLMGMAYQFQRAILLKGIANCGKSRVLVIMRGLLPDNAVCMIPPTDWSDPFIPSTFSGKVMNSAGEISESKMVPGDIFKQIIEGEPITAQYKGKDHFPLKVTCAHWFGSNHLPKSRDTSDGFNRRWLILTFNKQVPSSQRRVDFAEVLLGEEREAIAAWALASVPRLLEQQEYTLPKSHIDAIEEMAETNCSVRFFLRRSTNIRTGVEQTKSGSEPILSSQLFAEYSRFCIMAGDVKPVGLRSFLQRMKNLEGTFGFKIVNVKDKNGQEELSFENIMFVN